MLGLGQPSFFLRRLFEGFVSVILCLLTGLENNDTFLRCRFKTGENPVAHDLSFNLLSCSGELKEKGIMHMHYIGIYIYMFIPE